MGVVEFYFEFYFIESEEAMKPIKIRNCKENEAAS